jgi:hypothetical protein
MFTRSAAVISNQCHGRGKALTRGTRDCGLSCPRIRLSGFAGEQLSKVDEIFLPAKVMRDLGYHLESEKLIIVPSIHRTSAIKQGRLDRPLGDIAVTYIERGFQGTSCCHSSLNQPG